MFAHIRWISLRYFSYMGLMQLLLVVQILCLPTIEQVNTQRSLNGVTQYEEKKQFFNRPELEDTIEEVQKILSQDPSLPRLTRGEIEELYEKVTREEYEKSIQAGDIGRADSMRALMLVLPYNTDNNTEENLQELYTRPPVTKVIDVYTPPQPIQFVTADPSSAPKSETVPVGQMSATTYKPILKVTPADFSPTTYHPINTFTHSTSNYPDSVTGFKPITSGLPVYNYALNAAHVAQTVKPGQRFSSHYNAKNADFLKQTRPKVTTSTVKPMADILESFGIVGRTQFKNHPEYVDDFYPAESAPQSVISTYVPQTVSVAQLQELHAQILGPRIRPDAYSSFKPLNIGEEIRIKPEVEGYLTRFGIVANRKRKAIKKNNDDENDNDNEPMSEESELSATKILSTDNPKRARKGVDNKTNGNTELEKLLENLQELERLNINPKLLKTTMTSTSAPPTTKRTTTTTTKATKTTTMKIPTSTVRDLITNGAPMLVEAKKPVRRIDPNFDLNYGASSNKQTDTQNNADQLEKLLENLQELQKLRINPENVLKAAVVPTNVNRLSTTTPKPVTSTITTRGSQTTAAIRAMTIINRFSDARYQEQQKQQQQQQQQVRQTDSQQLEEVLKQLQAAEQIRKTTTSTTKRPTKTNALGLNDLSQLRRLLGNDSELERLYNNARDRYQPVAKTTTTTTTTSTTGKPDMTELGDLEDLQKYLALLERSTTTTTTTSKPTTTRKPTTTTTTSTTTESSAKKSFVGNDQIIELINRVQELERANAKKITPTQNPNLPFLGFTSRNVNSPKSIDNAFIRSSNDFAQLQQLFKKVQDAEQSSYGTVEISTPTTVAKANAQTNRSKSQDFAQRIIDITNDTGSGSSLQQVDPNEFVHLQKLLKKVQELERVKIGPDGIMQSVTSAPTAKIQREITEMPALKTVESEKVSVYAVPATKVENYVSRTNDMPSVRIGLPVYQETTTKRAVKNNEPLQTSSEELRELVMSPPTGNKNLATDTDFERYQEFFSSLEDNERNAYKNLQPPVIQKTVTKEPPRFVATRKPQEIPKINAPQSQNELKELQKLLNNAQELEKLGVTLPSSLSKKIETKLVDSAEATDVRHGFKKIPTVSANKNYLKQNPEVERYLEKYGILDAQDDNSKLSTSSNEITTNGNELNEAKAETAVFSLTTIKPQATTKEPRTTTESAVQLPIFSATKIIEAAIKRAANKIGVSTEKSVGFRRRSDTDIMDMDTDDGDLMAEFSEINYQIAAPENSPEVNDTHKKQGAQEVKGNSTADLSQDLGELQRLISNLKELQKLNITPSSETLRIADAAYLDSIKKTSNSESEVVKNRRQSVSLSAAVSSTTTDASETEELLAPTTPTRVNLNLSLDDGDTNAEATNQETSSSTTEAIPEEGRNGAISDLEDSFGPDPNAEAQPPPKKKNGFYFLADWNSFLEVGDGDDQVVVRFSPKIGDPRLFIPVKIP